MLSKGLLIQLTLPATLLRLCYGAIPPRSAVQKTTPDRTSCQYPSNSRKCWSDGYSIDTNYYQEHPHTGVIREYWWVVQNTSIAPDGYEQWALTINGSMPGPAIAVDWGDKVIVHVKNELENNGTAIHFHGVRMFENNHNDGVPGVTQCPIAPGDFFTYRFTAEQYGSSWYHSHFSLQLSLGLQGPIVIHGPATAEYDEDYGMLLMTDWSHASLFAEWWYQRVPSGPPSMANSLINGQNVFSCDSANDPRCIGNGTRPEWQFESGKKYRFRVANTALYSNIRFTVDGHALTVIAADFVPIVPYVTDHVLVAAGQRYDVIIEANAKADNYWLRFHWQEKCCPNDAANNTLGVIRYDSTSKALPKSVNQVARLPDSCADEPASKLVPWLELEVGTPFSITSLNLADDPKLPYPKGFMWTLNTTYQWINFSAPTNLMLAEQDYEFPTEALVFPKDQASMDGPANEKSWVYFVFNDISERNRSHPMHLHGHDFFLLGTGFGNWTGEMTTLNLKNPPRRDSATWPGRGWAVYAFKTDNPGVWLFHCYIGWHSSEGLGVQFVEHAPRLVQGLQDAPIQQHRDTCAAWRQYWTPEDEANQEDTGI